MSKKDYREKIEEHRQEIELEEVPSRMSRTNKQQNYKKSSLMRNLTILFICIPLLVLVYVSFFYEPKVPEVEAVEPQIEIQTNESSTSNSNNQAAAGNEKEDDETEKNEDAAKVEKEAAAKAEAEKKAKEEAAKLAEQKAKDEEAKKLAAQQQAQQASPKTYTVKPGDTLYSISRAHYNGEIKVQNIIQANNLSSESITVGQTLIIPQ